MVRAQEENIALIVHVVHGLYLKNSDSNILKLCVITKAKLFNAFVRSNRIEKVD